MPSHKIAVTYFAANPSKPGHSFPISGFFGKKLSMSMPYTVGKPWLSSFQWGLASGGKRESILSNLHLKMTTFMVKKSVIKHTKFYEEFQFSFLRRKKTSQVHSSLLSDISRAKNFWIPWRFDQVMTQKTFSHLVTTGICSMLWYLAHKFDVFINYSVLINLSPKDCFESVFIVTEEEFEAKKVLSRVISNQIMAQIFNFLLSNILSWSSFQQLRAVKMFSES